MNRPSFLCLTLVLGSSLLNFTAAEVACVSDAACQELYKTGNTVCLIADNADEGVCSNPYQRRCLLDTAYRVCNSDDIANNATENGLCILPPQDYPEIRLYQQNWESAIFQSWMYQILLMEVLGVPTTIGLNTGHTERNSFYSPAPTMVYGTSAYPYWALDQANRVPDNDCRNTEEDCAQLIVEEWGTTYEPFVQNGSIVPPVSNGQIAKFGLYIPTYTAGLFPATSIYFGLQGEANREKLASIFKRPQTWQQYCEELSPTNCTTPDQTAQRGPATSEEAGMYYLKGLYQGYFRATQKNDCSNGDGTCTGHVVGAPCTWNSHLESQLYWNDIIGLELDGPFPPSGSYDSASMFQVWRAANATRSHVIMTWYSPELLLEEFFSTDYTFQEVSLPAPTNYCLEHRASFEEKCSDSQLVRRGDPAGSCASEPMGLLKLMASSFMKANDDLEEAEKSPAADLVKNFKLSELDMNSIFNAWSKLDVDQYGNGARTVVCNWMRENIEELQWFIPAGFPRVVSSKNRYEAWFVVFAQLCAIFVGFVSLIGMALLWMYRQTKIMVFAQPEFLFLMLVGYASTCAGAAVLAMEPTQETCVTLNWFFLQGITVELVPVLVKTSAINHLVQSSKKSQRVNISRRNLLLRVFICNVLVAGFMLAWVLVDPPYGRVTRSLDRDDPKIVNTDMRCSSDYYYWRIVAYAWEVFLLVLAAVLAFQSRGILKQFNESNSLGIMVYSHFMFLVLRGLTQIFYYSDVFNYATVTAALSYNYTLDSLVAMLIYIFPKLEIARRQPISYLHTKLATAAATSRKSSEFPDEDFRLLCCTANIGNAEPTQESMEAWIPPRGACEKVKSLDGRPLHRGIFDLIVVGMQESTWTEATKTNLAVSAAEKAELDEEDILNAMEEHHTATLRGLMQDILGREYQPIVEELRGQMRIFIWASNGIVDDITNVMVDGANTGIGGVMANKGGIVVSMNYNTTRLSFLTAHLAAHEGASYYKARCENITTILRESSTYALSSKLDASVSSHHMFAMGDLNFRTRFDDTPDAKHDDNVQRALGFVNAKDYEGLYEFDELQQGLRGGDLLMDFDTLPCHFPPTFKVQRSEGFEYKEQRTPSYADRILYKSANGLQHKLHPVAYEPCVDFITSDHKPIRGAFNIETNKPDSTPGMSDVDIQLEFRSMECSGLPAADTNGYSDPYLMFLWDDSIEFKTSKIDFKDKIRALVNGKSWPRTKHKSKTLNPQWEGEFMSLEASKVKLSAEPKMYIVAMDFDTLAIRDDFLGCLSLSIREIASLMHEESETILDFDRPLQSGGKLAGRIKFQLYVQLTARSAFSFKPVRESMLLRGSSKLNFNMKSSRGFNTKSTDNMVSNSFVTSSKKDMV